MVVTRRSLVGTVAAAVVPAAVLGDTVAAAARGWRPGATLERAVIAAAVAVLAWLAWQWARPRGRQRLDRRGAQFALAAGSFVLAWSAAELLLPLVPRPRFHLRPSNFRYTFTPDPQYWEGIEGRAQTSYNSWGLRGSEAAAPRDGAYRILCVGGSTTEGLYLDDRETWPALLEAALSSATGQAHWVAAAAASDLGTGEHLRFLAESPLVEQVDAVIVLPGANDLIRALLGIDLSGSARPLWSHSRVLGLVREVWNVRLGMGALRYDERGAAVAHFRRGRVLAAGYELPDLSGPLEAYRQRLLALDDAARRRGLRLVLATQPTRGGAQWREKLELVAAKNADLLREGVDRYNDVLRQVAQLRGIELVELSPLEGRDELFADAYHFNERGAREAAELVAAHWLESNPKSAAESLPSAGRGVGLPASGLRREAP